MFESKLRSQTYAPFIFWMCLHSYGVFCSCIVLFRQPAAWLLLHCHPFFSLFRFPYPSAPVGADWSAALFPTRSFFILQCHFCFIFLLAFRFSFIYFPFSLIFFHLVVFPIFSLLFFKNSRENVSFQCWISGLSLEFFSFQVNPHYFSFCFHFWTVVPSHYT